MARRYENPSKSMNGCPACEQAAKKLPKDVICEKDEQGMYRCRPMTAEEKKAWLRRRIESREKGIKFPNPGPGSS